ncbi:hypothetical protein HDK77DRAFT_279634 [Phyllosticta capitalensis]
MLPLRLLCFPLFYTLYGRTFCRIARQKPATPSTARSFGGHQAPPEALHGRGIPALLFNQVRRGMSQTTCAAKGSAHLDPFRLLAQNPLLVLLPRGNTLGARNVAVEDVDVGTGLSARHSANRVRPSRCESWAHT